MKRIVVLVLVGLVIFAADIFALKSTPDLGIGAELTTTNFSAVGLMATIHIPGVSLLRPRRERQRGAQRRRGADHDGGLLAAAQQHRHRPHQLVPWPRRVRRAGVQPDLGGPGGSAADRPGRSGH